jgi:pseudaminic acid synthase
MQKPIKLDRKKVGNNQPVFIIAEISANHAQDINRAIRMIKEAKKCGADAVKFQTYTPNTLTIDADNVYFRIKHPEWGGQTLYELYKKAYTPWKWFKMLKETADNEGIVFFATAFDKSSVDFLEDLGVACHKIASFELVDLPLIEHAAKTKKPLILSTGMASKEEIREAVTTARRSGAQEIVLLKCVSNYPSNPSDMNLKTIPDMKRRFKCQIGLSDHTVTIGTSVTAVSLGAVMIEKHFTLSRKKKTPDSFFSLEPRELRDLVDNVRLAEQALGVVHYGFTKEERKSLIFRRSLFAVKDIKKGEVLTNDKIRSIRPANGLKPKYLKKIIGKKARKDIKRGTPLKDDMVDS